MLMFGRLLFLEDADGQARPFFANADIRGVTLLGSLEDDTAWQRLIAF